MYLSQSSKQSVMADTLITKSGNFLGNGTPSSLKASLQASSRDLSTTEQIRSPDNPQWVNSLAAAFLNHGKNTANLGTEDSGALAKNDFFKARDMLRTIKDLDHRWPSRNLAISSLSLSVLSLDEGKIEKANKTRHKPPFLNKVK